MSDLPLTVRILEAKNGRLIGYQVYDYETQVVLATFKIRNFGGASFWRRAKDAAHAWIDTAQQRVGE